jgi:hypothetical protein
MSIRQIRIHEHTAHVQVERLKLLAREVYFFRLELLARAENRRHLIYDVNAHCACAGASTMSGGRAGRSVVGRPAAADDRQQVEDAEESEVVAATGDVDDRND